MEYAARKIPMPKHLEAKEPFAVHRFCIDSNHHVNNGKYVLMAEEFLPEQFLVSELRVEYRKAAVLGDIMYPFVENTEEKIAVVLADKEKEPICDHRIFSEEEMIKLGEYQELIVVKKVEFGVYLAQKPEDETRVLLPAKVPQR